MVSLEGHLVALARPFALVVTLIAFLACDDNPVEPPFTLMLAQMRWNAANIDSYEMTVRRLCFCGLVDPVRVTVSSGTIVSRVSTRTGEPVPDNIASLYPDVPGLFTIVADARTNADALHVDYDVTYGFPGAIAIDWMARAADDEVTYYVEDFEVSPE